MAKRLAKKRRFKFAEKGLNVRYAHPVVYKNSSEVKFVEKPAAYTLAKKLLRTIKSFRLRPFCRATTCRICTF